MGRLAQRLWADWKDSGRRAGRRPDDLVREQVFIHDRGKAIVMPEGRAATDSEAGRLADKARVGALEGLVDQFGGARFIEPIVDGDEEQQRPPARTAPKYKRLDDLPDLAAAGGGGFLRRPCRFRHDVNRDVEPEGARGVIDLTWTRGQGFALSRLHLRFLIPGNPGQTSGA